MALTGPDPAFDAPVDSERTCAADAGPSADSGDAHAVRLCLDSQVDALLLTVGAAAAETDEADEADAPPWRRWIAQDVERACSLAAEALTRGAALPSPLGSDLHRSVPATTIDTLVALYGSMTSRLADLMRIRPSGTSALAATLQSCQTRLTELERYRLTTTPPRGSSLAHSERHFLPGELLG